MPVTVEMSERRKRKLKMRRRSKMQNMETPSDVEMEVDSHDSLNADIDDTSDESSDCETVAENSPPPIIRRSRAYITHRNGVMTSVILGTGTSGGRIALHEDYNPQSAAILTCHAGNCHHTSVGLDTTSQKDAVAEESDSEDDSGTQRQSEDELPELPDRSQELASHELSYMASSLTRLGMVTSYDSIGSALNLIDESLDQEQDLMDTRRSSMEAKADQIMENVVYHSDSEFELVNDSEPDSESDDEDSPVQTATDSPSCSHVIKEEDNTVTATPSLLPFLDKSRKDMDLVETKLQFQSPVEVYQPAQGDDAMADPGIPEVITMEWYTAHLTAIAMLKSRFPGLIPEEDETDDTKTEGDTLLGGPLLG